MLRRNMMYCLLFVYNAAVRCDYISSVDIINKFRVVLLLIFGILYICYYKLHVCKIVHTFCKYVQIWINSCFFIPPLFYNAI